MVGIVGVGMIPPISLYIGIGSIVCGIIYIGYILHLINVGRSFWWVVCNVLFVCMMRGVVEYNWLVEPFNFLPGGSGVLVKLVACVAVVFMALYVGMFTAIASGCVWLVKKRYQYVRDRRFVFVGWFCVMFAFMEWVRSWLFTGFIWNPMVVMWSWSPVMMSIVSWLSFFSAGILTVYLLGIGYIIYPCIVGTKKWKSVYGYLIELFIILCLWIGIGVWKVYFVPVKTMGKKVRIIDAKIDQSIINNFSYGRTETIKNFVAGQYAELVRLDGWDDVDLIVLPETSSLCDLTNNEFMEIFYANMNNDKSNMIVGFNRYSDIDFDSNDFSVYNSIGVLDKYGVHATYDKMHLVPFGEFVPFRKLLKMAKFTAGGRDFSRGKERNKLIAGGVNLYPLLCYEAIFETDVPDGVDAIVTISNDAWFGEWGKVQHLEMAKFRAVEAGVPLIRAANMGVNDKGAVVIDERGRMVPPFEELEFVHDFMI